MAVDVSLLKLYADTATPPGTTVGSISTASSVEEYVVPVWGTSVSSVA